ncbi:MAG: aminomethyl-transferring glycine dehydrogenase subunit GcvPA [Firmicutes bacterium]|nr:aminomethyl-transferring glycine dehydrogenase subunit GcvPA [Bacillota bacterium]
MNYVPHTDRDRSEMLAQIGVSSVDELFSDIPREVRLERDLRLPKPVSEYELARHMAALAGKNTTADDLVSFLGAGAYDHFVPSVVRHIVSRSEFYTAYTPYQAEISQGMLQAIFEYQTLMCELTAMDVSNASLYDGATAVAEAAAMACRQTRRQQVVVSAAVHPEYRATLKTYARNLGIEVAEAGIRDGATDFEELEQLTSGATACVILQNPNFLGSVEAMGAAAEIAHRSGALFVACVDPISLGILAPPGEYGADIAVGEGQGLGSPMSFGGPYLGFLTCRQELIRNMPGRVAGETHDSQGRRGYILTLQAREQHIRRERATSNICSNEALSALAAAVYLSWLGKDGIREVADLCLQKAHYAFDRITAIPGFRPASSAPFFKEFAVRMPVPLEQASAVLLRSNMLGGLALGRFYRDLGDAMLIAVTEKRTKDEIDSLCRALEGLA